MKLKLFGTAILGSVLGVTVTSYSILKFLNKHERIRRGLIDGIADEIYNTIFDDNYSRAKRQVHYNNIYERRS